MFELDCQLTRDHQVVVSHDDHLQRVAGQEVYISQTDYQDLPPLMSVLQVAFEPCTTSTGGDTRIPLLKEVFELFPQVPMNIDLKMGGEVLIREVNQLIQDYKRQDITVWGSPHRPVLDKCHKENPETHKFTGIKEIVRIVLSFYSGILPFLPIREELYEIPMPAVLVRDGGLMDHVGFGYKLLIHFLDWMLMSPILFRHLQRRGMQVYIWVLNEESEYRRAYQLGADGVMTDHPTKLKQFLEQHPEYR